MVFASVMALGACSNELKWAKTSVAPSGYAIAELDCWNGNESEDGDICAVYLHPAKKEFWLPLSRNRTARDTVFLGEDFSSVDIHWEGKILYVDYYGGSIKLFRNIWRSGNNDGDYVVEIRLNATCSYECVE